MTKVIFHFVSFHFVPFHFVLFRLMHMVSFCFVSFCFVSFLVVSVHFVCPACSNFVALVRYAFQWNTCSMFICCRPGSERIPVEQMSDVDLL